MNTLNQKLPETSVKKTRQQFNAYSLFFGRY